MKKLLALLLCVVMLVPMAAMADDGKIHITYSFWGNQTEAESVQAALDTFNAMQDKIFVEPMQIPNEEYTQTLVNYAIADQLPDCDGFTPIPGCATQPARYPWPAGR